MRTLAIGDIHGCLKALETLVQFVNFSSDDTIITLGDYIDRGPNSKGVIDYLIDLKESHNLITLKGNHEELMENAPLTEQDLMNWLLNGGIETLTSFSALEFENIPKKYWDFLADCQSHHETDDFIFVHAGLSPDLSIEEQSRETMFWIRFEETQQHNSGKTVICGHTPQSPPRPTVTDHSICIDSAACNSGWLTCFDAESGDYWQANQKGNTRQGNIKDL